MKETTTAVIKDEQPETHGRQIVIALAGNPNAGKTTLFNALTGLRQKVANYSGVTVEKKEGLWNIGGETAKLIDLPGLYSLDAVSIDEKIANDVLLGKIEETPKPDAIIAVVDATNLERNLYLVTQLFEYDIPVIVALTMVDLAEKQDLQIDTEKLSALLKIPVVAVKAMQKKGIDELSRKTFESAKTTVNKELNNGGSKGSGTKKPHEILLGLSSEESSNKKIFARYNFISEWIF